MDRRKGLPGKIIGEVKSAERHRLGAAVVNLKPVAAVGRVGHPFVDREARGGAETGGAIEGVRSRHVERPGTGTVGEPADGKIAGLHAVADGVN